MRASLLVVLSVLSLRLLAGAGEGDSGAVRLDRDPSMRFLLRMQEGLEDVSPEYLARRLAFQKRMEEILRQAETLNGDWKRQQRRDGQPAPEERARLQAETRRLLEAAIAETESFLGDMHAQVAKNKAKLADRLLPAEPAAP